MSDWKSRAKPVSMGTNDWKSRATTLPAKNYDSPEALAAEGEATKMAEIKMEHDNPLEVATRSVTRGLTSDYMDEMGGVLGAVGDQIKGTPKTFGESYKENRDYERLIQKVDDINHPIASTTGKIGGGVATGLLLPGANTFNGTVGYAAAQGLGASDAEDLKGMAKDAALGGAMGAGGYVAGKAIPAIAGAVRHPVDTVKNVAGKVTALSGAVSQGAREGAKDLPFGLSQAGGVIGGAKALIKTNQDRVELNAIVNNIKKSFGPGAATDLSNEDVLMSKLLEPGDNIAKRWVAGKYAAVHGGDSEQYLKLLSQSADDTAAARSFDKIKAGEDLASDISGSYKELQANAGKAYQDASGRAREVFPQMADEPHQIIDGVYNRIADDSTISGQSKAFLVEAKKILGDDFNSIAPQDQFDRLLASRKKLGLGVKWAARSGDPGKEAVEEAYHGVGKLLKSIDDQAGADAGYSAFKGLEDNFFKQVGDVKRNRIQSFDPIKIEKMFSGSTSGRRLAKQIQAAQELIESGKIPQEQAEKLQSTLNKIEQMQTKSGTQRDLNNFRYKDAGPSSPAIQRMSAIAGKDSATTTAVRAPQMFLKMREEAARTAKAQFGKSIDDLMPSDREKVAKYALWVAQNEGATDTDVKRKLLELGLMDTKK